MPAISDLLNAQLVSGTFNGSSVECFLRGQRVSHAAPADCHGKPPFWDFWRDYRNCFATNVCLHENKLILYSGDRPTSALGVSESGHLACNNWHGTSYSVKVKRGQPPRAGSRTRREGKAAVQVKLPLWSSGLQSSAYHS